MRIPYGKQIIDEKDISAVIEVLTSDWLTQGPAVEAFEGNLSKKVNSKYNIVLNSATSALHVACMAGGLSKGDILWTVPNTFVASANCALYCEAKIDFVDINLQTFNICVEALEEKLIKAKQLGKLPKILIPVHFGGLPTDQEKIYQLAKEYDFKVIEDASHSIGASNNHEPVGSCKWSDATIFSFHPVKVITTGEGGSISTNSQEIYSKSLSLRTHGITRNYKDMIISEPDGWHYEQHSLGYNYRMTDISAALGNSQLTKLDNFVELRNKIASNYVTAFQETNFSYQIIPDNFYSSYHLFVITMPEYCSQLRRRLFNELRSVGIGVNVHYEPVHLQPYYRDLGFHPGDFPNAEKYSQGALTLPLFPSLKKSDQEEVIQRILELSKNG